MQRYGKKISFYTMRETQTIRVYIPRNRAVEVMSYKRKGWVTFAATATSMSPAFIEVDAPDPQILMRVRADYVLGALLELQSTKIEQMVVLIKGSKLAIFGCPKSLSFHGMEKEEPEWATLIKSKHKKAILLPPPKTMWQILLENEE